MAQHWHDFALRVLPDALALEERPRSWTGVVATLCGTLLLATLAVQSLVFHMHDEPATSIALSTSAGAAHPLVIACDYESGCDVVHAYAAEPCASAVAAALGLRSAERGDARGVEGVGHVRHGELGTVFLCSSAESEWTDGVRIGARVYADEEPLQYRFGDEREEFGQLPYAPVAGDGAQSTATRVPFSMVVQRQRGVEGGGSRLFHAGAGGVSTAHCKDSDDAADGAEVADGRREGETAGRVCYHLTLDRLVATYTAAEERPASALFAAWGGAYALVFGLGAACVLIIRSALGCEARRAGLRRTAQPDAPPDAAVALSAVGAAAPAPAAARATPHRAITLPRLVSSNSYARVLDAADAVAGLAPAAGDNGHGPLSPASEEDPAPLLQGAAGGGSVASADGGLTIQLPARGAEAPAGATPRSPLEVAGSGFDRVIDSAIASVLHI